jgi:hypothetical protein
MVPAIDTEDNVPNVRSSQRSQITLNSGNGSSGTVGTIGTVIPLICKPAELVSLNHGAVDGVKFAAVVEVFVHD